MPKPYYSLEESATLLKISRRNTGTPAEWILDLIRDPIDGCYLLPS